MGKMYIGVDGGSGGVARNVKTIYVGVNGVARKVIKGYVGVNGVARQFWGDGGGGITIDFEYVYGSGGLYSVHNYLTLQDVLEVCFETYLQYAGTYPSTYAHIQNLIDNWQTIKASILNKIARSGLTLANTECRISSMKSGQDMRTTITVYFDTYTSTDPFPMIVKINRQQTSALGLIRYTLQPQPAQPSITKQLVSYVYSDSYSVGSVSTASGNANYIGYNSYDNTGTYAVYLASFGMKKV